MWNRVNGLYKASTVKSLLMFSSGASFICDVFKRQQYYSLVTRYLLQPWAYTTLGAWIVGSILIYTSRAVERRIGERYFCNFLFVSGAVSLTITLFLGSLGLPVVTSLIHILACATAVEHLLLVPPLSSTSFLGIPITSNIVIYGLIILLSSTVPGAILSITGVLGALVAHHVRCILPQRVAIIFGLMGAGESPAEVYSGATIEVQQQQQYDRIEQVMMGLQRYRLDTVPSMQDVVLRHRGTAHDNLVQQMVVMGFAASDARRALLLSGGDLAAAVNLLSNRN